MLPFTTDDGSISYRKTYESEPYHTKSGGVVEAIEKHAKALMVWEKENPVIFDVCSGLSYSSAVAIDEIRKHNNFSEITIYLFENDLEVLEKNLDLPDTLEYTYEGKKGLVNSYVYIKNAIRNFIKYRKNVYIIDNLKIYVIFGNFEETINTVNDKADFVFYAPFSPKITPDMWTEEKFQKINSQMKKGAKLSTYAYARVVRDGLLRAGFIIEDGPILGRRSPSLIGTKK